jgi:hypothetical protein
MKLHKDWKRVWRRFSFQALGWGVAMLTGYSAIPEDLQQVINTKLYMAGVALLLLIGMVGSCIEQPKARSDS